MRYGMHAVTLLFGIMFAMVGGIGWVTAWIMSGEPRAGLVGLLLLVPGGVLIVLGVLARQGRFYRRAKFAALGLAGLMLILGGPHVITDILFVVTGDVSFDRGGDWSTLASGGAYLSLAYLAAMIRSFRAGVNGQAANNEAS